MTEQQRKAMKLALDFIVVSSAKNKAWYTTEEFEVVTALRQALEQPEQETEKRIVPPVPEYAFDWCDFKKVELIESKQDPVAYKEECWACGGEECVCAKRASGYFSPPKRKWVGLTDEEMENLWNRYAHMEMMRAIESKLKEKNT